MNFIIYHHKNLALAKYVVQCSHRLNAADKLKSVAIKSLPQQPTHREFATLPTALRRLLFLLGRML